MSRFMFCSHKLHWRWVKCILLVAFFMCLFLGIPYPLNLETAEEVEAIVRENGVVPATIAILDGIRFEVRKTGKACPNGKKVLKRQLAGTLQMLNGATTVSAATFFAAMVGIRVFVTGGIGRVHRRGGQTMDISYDVTELGRRPVAVISAGIKSILDIARTLEYLVPCRVDSPEECALEKNITGNAETRFLLARLASNIALVKNSVVLGAKISVVLAQLK